MKLLRVIELWNSKIESIYCMNLKKKGDSQSAIQTQFATWNKLTQCTGLIINDIDLFVFHLQKRLNRCTKFKLKKKPSSLIIYYKNVRSIVPLIFILAHFWFIIQQNWILWMAWRESNTQNDINIKDNKWQSKFRLHEILNKQLNGNHIASTISVEFNFCCWKSKRAINLCEVKIR